MKVHLPIAADVHGERGTVLRFPELKKKPERRIIRGIRKPRELGSQFRKDRRLGMVTEQFIADRTPPLPASERFRSPHHGIEFGDTAPPVAQLKTVGQGLWPLWRPFGWRRDGHGLGCPDHMGGLTPFFSRVARVAETDPSGFLWPKMKMAAPGFTRLISPGTKATTGTSGGTVISASCPL
jgi:hypothetical protein